MTRKHFKMLADAISKLSIAVERERICELIGEVCAEANGRFDWYKWRIACKIEETESAC